MFNIYIYMSNIIYIAYILFISYILYMYVYTPHIHSILHIVYPFCSNYRYIWLGWLLRKPPLPCHRGEGGTIWLGGRGGVGVPAHIYIYIYTFINRCTPTRSWASLYLAALVALRVVCLVSAPTIFDPQEFATWHWPGGRVGHGCDYVWPGEWSQPQSNVRFSRHQIPSILPSNPSRMYFLKDKQTMARDHPTCVAGGTTVTFNISSFKVVGLAVSSKPLLAVSPPDSFEQFKKKNSPMRLTNMDPSWNSENKNLSMG